MEETKHSEQDIRRMRIVGQYRAAGIEFSEVGDDTIIAAQVRVTDGYIFTTKELHDRARTVYPEKRYKIKPSVYRLGLDMITVEWVKERMKEYGVTPKTLVAQLGITQGEISLLLTEKRGMTRPTRAMFYYYFLTYQLNRDLRRPPITAEELNEALEYVRAKR